MLLHSAGRGDFGGGGNLEGDVSRRYLLESICLAIILYGIFAETKRNIAPKFRFFSCPLLHPPPEKNGFECFCAVFSHNQARSLVYIGSATDQICRSRLFTHSSSASVRQAHRRTHRRNWFQLLMLFVCRRPNDP